MSQSSEQSEGTAAVFVERKMQQYFVKKGFQIRSTAANHA